MANPAKFLTREVFKSSLEYQTLQSRQIDFVSTLTLLINYKVAIQEWIHSLSQYDPFSKLDRETVALEKEDILLILSI